MQESRAWETFEIAGKICRIFRHGDGGPVFLWAYYPHDGRELEQLEEAVKQTMPDEAYTVAAYQVSDWNRDLSPWEAPGASAGDRFFGGGRDTLGWILEEYRPWLQKCCPDCEKTYLMGYSLAGLFALWSLYETDCFDGAVCCSGSLWIEGWDNYMSGHRLKAPADVYLSLGGREEKTKNHVMAHVGDRTRMQEKLLRRDPKIRRCILEWDGGGHFADSAGRLAKGVRWIVGKVRDESACRLCFNLIWRGHRCEGGRLSMAVILGIDVGTSSLKGMLLDTESGSIQVEAEEYAVEIPHPGWAEQDPDTWWQSLLKVLGRLREDKRILYDRISAVGFSGQMHGLVLTDDRGTPVRPAILWLDQRAKDQLNEIEKQVTREEMGSVFRNRVSSGFAFPSLLWVREHEPDVLARAGYLLCPKDFLRFKMTGHAGAEVVDASSTGLFETGKRDWAWEMIGQFGLPEKLFLHPAESMDIAGEISEECAKETGLRKGIPVIYGTGDQPAQSIGNGVIGAGRMISNIGTGGQISAYADSPVYDRLLRTNTFCHAVPGAYTIFGATLCAGMSLNWAKNKLFYMESYDQISKEASSVQPGASGLLYLPYLSGERTPHMDPDMRGMFWGLALAHDRRHMLRAIMEGVVYSLKDCLEILKEMGIDAETIIASGGGASSPVWLQIQADILEKPVQACTVREQACLGSCLLAAAAVGAIPSLKKGIRRFVTMSDRIYMPDPKNRAVYREQYETYRKLGKEMAGRLR